MSHARTTNCRLKNFSPQYDDTAGTTNSGIERAAGTLRAYREWVAAHSRLGRVLLVVGTLFGLLLVGLAVETLQATVGVAVTMVITWAALLFVLYTWWAAVRPGVLSVVGGS